jgi:hypothetical protein
MRDLTKGREMRESVCSKCFKSFDDAIPEAPLTLCPVCERGMLDAEKEHVRLSSDGGFGPRSTTGKKVGGPIGTDEDADKRKDPD